MLTKSDSLSDIEVARIIQTLNAQNIVIYLASGKLKTKSEANAITSDIVNLIKSNKPALIRYLAKRDTKICKQAYTENTDLPPLSFAQQRLWLLDRIDGNSAHYNIPIALRLDGQLNLKGIQHAFDTIISRHEALRTNFVRVNKGMASQVIRPIKHVPIKVTELSALSESEQAAHVEILIADEAGLGFDLTCDRMLRVQILRLSETQHFVLITVHHIASDGWSMGLLVNEFGELYRAYTEGRKASLPELCIQYSDYAYWQRDWLRGEVLEGQLRYWKSQLHNLPVVHSLPLDYPRPGVQSYDGENYSSHLNSALCRQLKQLCHEQSATLFMGLHAAFSVLLSRYSNEEDIVVGSPVANREQPEIASLIGFFVNTLVLRSNVSGDQSFKSLLLLSRSTLLEAYAHQQVPFEKLVEELQPERSMSHGALFQIMLALQNNDADELNLPGLRVSPLTRRKVKAKYDLSLNIVEVENGLSLAWEYNKALFLASTIEQMARHFSVLLSGLVAYPDKPVLELDLLDKAERNAQFMDWNNTRFEYPAADKCLHQMFEYHADHRPDAVALVYEDESVTYDTLNTQSNQLAHFLIGEGGVLPNTLVGICVERSLSMVVGILGILKAGGAYVPLDPNYNKERIAYMLEDTQVSTVLTQTEVNFQVPLGERRILCLNDTYLQQELAKQPVHNPYVPDLSSSQMAYLIYTSGSTGRPKGVMVEHRSVVNLVQVMQRQFQLQPDDGKLQFASMNFDASVEEIFSALCSGCRLILRTDSWLKSIPDFWKYCDRNNVTVLTLPTAFWRETLQNKSFPRDSVRLIVVAGEKVNDTDIEAWYDESDSMPTLVNGYGPTECTVATSLTKIVKGEGSHIGHVIDNSSFYILNERLQPVPLMVAGELYIGGAGIARGYWNRSELTSQRFIVNPFYDESDISSSARLYKTGDIVRRRVNGDIEYLGRDDQQVKIRGFRIELGEIESALLKQPGVNEALVVARESESGESYLIGYYKSHEKITRELFREGLLDAGLAEYMLPSFFVRIETFPINQSGKVDLRALPDVDISVLRESYVDPITEIEVALCDIWRDVLNIEKVGVEDNFFSLGGHSLLVLRLTDRMNQAGINVSLQDIMKYQSVRALLDYLKNRPDKARHPALVDLNQVVCEKKLYLLPVYGGTVNSYRDLAFELNDMQVTGISAPFFYEEIGQWKNMEELADHYANIIASDKHIHQYASQKLYIGGFSFAGAQSPLVAKALSNMGVKVSGVIMLDAYYDVLQARDGSYLDRLYEFVKFLRIVLPNDICAQLETLNEEDSTKIFNNWLIDKLGQDFPRNLVDQFVNFHLNLDKITYQNPSVALDSPVICINNCEHPSFAENISRWRTFLSTTVDIHAIDRSHWDFLTEKAVGELAAILTIWLQQTDKM